MIRAASTRARRRAVVGRVLRAVAAMLLLVALGVFHIWSRTRVLATGYDLGEAAREHARLASEHDRLRIEVETLRSPAALERFARTRLGMAPPAPGAVRAAGPRLALAGGGGMELDGVDRPGPAEPARSGSLETGRAPAPAAAVRVAFRGPLVAGRAPPAR